MLLLVCAIWTQRQPQFEEHHAQSQKAFFWCLLVLLQRQPCHSDNR